MKIGKKLRDRREDKDLTQSKVAKYAGIDQSNYSKMERDLGEPNLDQLRLLCEILEIDANELLNLKIHTEDEKKKIEFANEVKKLYKKYYGREES